MLIDDCCVSTNCLIFITDQMKKNISIQFKAALLLIVFSINTVMGFACAVGIDMGFNSKHPAEEVSETPIHTHVHADGKKHQHHDETTKHQQDSKEDSEKGGCCNDGVMKFQSLDKSLTQNGDVTFNTPVFTAMLSSFFGIEIFRPTQIFKQKYIFDFFHPRSPDIRILIQRFQI